MPVYTIEAGRALAIDGKIVATLHKANGSDAAGWPMDPTQYDALAHRIAAALNVASGADSLYDRLILADCETDSHESDLYIRNTQAARETLAAWNDAHPIDTRRPTQFISERDGRSWLEIPFAYAPWWRRRTMKAA
jgi:hypothetical protein